MIDRLGRAAGWKWWNIEEVMSPERTQFLRELEASLSQFLERAKETDNEFAFYRLLYNVVAPLLGKNT